MDYDLPAVGRLTPAWRDFFIVLGAVALLIVSVFYWAVAIRKRKRRVRKYRYHRRHHRSGNPPSQPQSPTPPT